MAVCLLLFGLCAGYVAEGKTFPPDVICVTDTIGTIPSAEAVRLAVQETYTAEIGVTEDLGPNDGVRIRQYREAVSQFDYPVSWCAIFVMYVYHVNDVDYKPANEWVPTWSNRNVVYAKGKSMEVSKGERFFAPTPQTGDVFTLFYASLKRDGHIGFVDKWSSTGDYVITVEGNTNIAGSRDGDGVYRKRRLKASIHKVMDYISPQFG